MRSRHRYAKANDQSISGPTAIALGASLMNKEIPEGTTVCARVYDNGKLAKPKALWRQLQGILRSSKEHRVIVGKGSESDFRQIIVMKKTSFFILNEVLEIGNLTEGVEAATRSNPKIEKASELFAQVRAVCPGGHSGADVNPQRRA